MVKAYVLSIWPDGLASTSPSLPEVNKLFGGKYSPAAKVEITIVKSHGSAGMCIAGGAPLPAEDMKFIKTTFSKAVMAAN